MATDAFVRLTRRSLLGGAAASLGAWATAGLGGCVTPAPTRFPQGVASGDPRPDGVVLWSRLEPRAADDEEQVALVVSRDELGLDVVRRETLRATPDADHTLRLRLDGLEAGRRYWYRFEAGGETSPLGRTKTAPAPDDERPLRFAFASCQDFVGRSFLPWSGLDELDLDFVLFLGDWIYEYETGSDVLRRQPDGRRVELPDGLLLDDGDEPFLAARTLADYRALYRAVATDPYLQRARQLHPFVIVQDDHEFANDAWQDVANDFHGRQGEEVSTERRRAATRAWIEHLPMDVAHHPERPFPEDVTPYRSLRFGRHAQLFLTEQRLYRDDHVVPEGPVDDEVGKFLENSAIGSRTFARKEGFDAREADVLPTMLGEAQKAWLLDGVRRSDASWKLIASQTVVAQMVLDLREMAGVPRDYQDRWYFKLDQWDGYRSERRELLEALTDVDDVVFLSGDIHGFYAAELHPDFDAPGERPAAVELVTAGISASPVFEQLVHLLDDTPLLAALGFEALLRDFDPTLARSGPHFRYLSSAAVGIALGTLDASGLSVTFIEVPDERAPEPGPERRRELRVERGSRRITGRDAS